MDMQSRFVAYEAKEARAESPVPLLIGLTGPSGSGKTFSALRIASGIREVVGGEIFVVDTESRRALHYAERFDFRHVNFEAPFGSLDYLEALRFCKSQGAGVVVIDSCSHEHDGPGGLLEQHEVELNRMAGDDYKRRESMQMLAWQKPKAGRRKLIAALTTELAMPVIFCFRAKQTTKPMKVDGKMKPVDLGFTSIGANEWLFEMALNAVLLPGSKGVPIWQSDMIGEQMAIKLPEQFFPIAERGGPLNEATGRFLAKWAAARKIGEAPPKQEGRRFEAETPARQAEEPNDFPLSDDNPTAAEGKPYDAFGDQFDGAEEPAWQAAVEAVLAGAREAKTTQALNKVDDEWLKHRAAVSDEAMVARVDDMIAAARADLRSK